MFESVCLHERILTQAHTKLSSIMFNRSRGYAPPRPLKVTRDLYVNSICAACLHRMQPPLGPAP